MLACGHIGVHNADWISDRLRASGVGIIPLAEIFQRFSRAGDRRLSTGAIDVTHVRAMVSIESQ